MYQTVPLAFIFVDYKMDKKHTQHTHNLASNLPRYDVLSMGMICKMFELLMLCVNKINVLIWYRGHRLERSEMKRTLLLQ